MLKGYDFLFIFTGGGGLATRVCMRDEDQGAVWQEPIYLGCGEKEENFTLADLAEVCMVNNLYTSL